MLQANTVLALGKKAATHNPRPGNMANHLSWQGVQNAINTGKGKATFAQVVAAIQAANPNNVGNAIGYTKYAVRNQWLVLAPKAQQPK
jgi:hypothetical protein